MPIILISPMDETPRVRHHSAPRLDTFEGKTVGLLDISKPGGKIFLDHIERLLRERYGLCQIIRESKPTFTKPAPDALLHRLLEAPCHAVIEALAD